MPCPRSLVRAELPPSTVRMRVADLSIRTGGRGPWGGQQVGQCGAHGDSTHLVLAREARDRGAFVAERRPYFLELVSGGSGWAAAVAALGFGRADPFGGQFVSQVALELPDGSDHVDDQGGGGVVGGQVVE